MSIRVFIGWSGALSNEAALILRDWLPQVIQSVKPYVSSEDLDKGARWREDLLAQLENCSLGILCVTQSNEQSAWMNYEAGALSKHFGRARVCPLLLDLSPTDLTGPLTQFQCASLNKLEMKRLLRTINDYGGEAETLTEKQLERAFERCWPELENRLRHVLAKLSEGDVTLEPDSRDTRLDEGASQPRDVEEAHASAPVIAWENIHNAASSLLAKIAASSFRPDTIIGVGRGGAVALGILAARLRGSAEPLRASMPIQLIDRRYLITSGRRERTIITGLHNIDIYKRNVLVLNADSYTGNTLEQARIELARLQPVDVKTASLYIFESEEGRAHQPFFWGRKISKTESSRRLPWRSRGYEFGELSRSELSARTLVVIHGLVGTGKTSVANALTKALDAYCIHTDVYWFRYGRRNRHSDPGVSGRHYALLYDLCWSAIGSGRDVVLDCTARWRSFRETLATGFAPRGTTVVFVSCSCSRKSALRRIAGRLYFGPHDMGDRSEYERVVRDYSPIDSGEAEGMDGVNLVHVDTDDLRCSIAYQHTTDRVKVSRVCEAIESGYLRKLRAAAQA